MNPEDIQRIESALALKLPESYQSVLLDYPCPESEDISRHGLFSDPQRVIEANEEHREDGWFGYPWPEDHLVIGDDGCGDTYFMVVGKDERVYFADHEGGALFVDHLEDCYASASVLDHVEGCMAVERDFEERQRAREERRRRKRWWQFWT